MKHSMVLIYFVSFVFFVANAFADIDPGNWAWFEDDAISGSATQIALDNTSISISEPNKVIRLRLELYNDFHADEYQTGCYLQYSASSSGPWLSLGENAVFDFYDSDYLIHGNQVSGDELQNSQINATPGKQIESNDPFIVGTRGYGTTEWDFNIQLTDYATPGDYFFKVNYSDPLSTGYTYPSLMIDSTLPVSLSTYTARQFNKNILLEWTTESEVDNLGFIIERKTQETEWTEIASYLTDGSLSGAGSTSSKTDYQFTDTNFESNRTYFYRLSNVSINNKCTVLDIISIKINERDQYENTELLPVIPNPFNPTAKIKYTLAEDSFVSISVFNSMGQFVKSVIKNQYQTSGSYSIYWDGNNNNGMKAQSGVYLIVLNTGGMLYSQKIILLK